MHPHTISHHATTTTFAIAIKIYSQARAPMTYCSIFYVHSYSNTLVFFARNLTLSLPIFCVFSQSCAMFSQTIRAFSHSSSVVLLSVCICLLTVASLVGGSPAWKPCAEIIPTLRLPCRCRAEQFGIVGGGGPTMLSVSMDCDRVVFQGDYPPIPHGTPVLTYTQRNSGQQFIPTQVRVPFGFCSRFSSIRK